MIDQFLRPWLIGLTVQNPKLFLLCSILGGLARYGLIGLFVGPVIVSLLMTTIQIYREGNITMAKTLYLQTLLPLPRLHDS